jgi:hypothetical protein
MLLKRDKRSGIYRFRLQVPDDLRNAGLLGWEITRSLRTTNLAEAKRRYPAALAWAQGQLDAARKALAQQQREVTEEELEDAYDASVTRAWRRTLSSMTGPVVTHGSSLSTSLTIRRSSSGDRSAPRH